MKAHSIRFSSIIVIIYLFCLFFIYIPLQETTASENNGEVHIGTSPSSGFLQAHDLAPGDSVAAALKIYNNGSHDLQYAVSGRLDQGAPDLFDALSLTISDQQDVLYEGPLSGLQDISLGSLAHSDRDNLVFTATLPKHAGNALQNQSASVAFDFIASSDGTQMPQPGDSFNDDATGNRTLPQTASPLYNILVIGLLLVGCGLLVWRFTKSH